MHEYYVFIKKQWPECEVELKKISPGNMKLINWANTPCLPSTRHFSVWFKINTLVCTVFQCAAAMKGASYESLVCCQATISLLHGITFHFALQNSEYYSICAFTAFSLIFINIKQASQTNPKMICCCSLNVRAIYWNLISLVSLQFRFISDAEKK